MADTDTSPKAGKAPKMFNIRINSGEDAADKGDVVVAHNFKQYVIQRDVNATVNEHIVNVLKDAVIETTAKDDKGAERNIRISRFSFSAEPA